ncbi:putative transcriptional regulator [Halarchaeum rubridurum]|uniref:Putative transcriptional regulator n=1 Tax=Halarchaeum rubridurum TaxID=489911 RepID=A0A830FUX5_9EURY|nr:helix-turn-helix domain-containing protein [Halarchaeum rubridurum]MBP1953482.1 putative transcriptional regulator [Halarchaeum rubridurum]GGM64885.1 hypothetical protein GCM10009017_13760 [Halarchaeum rubridurum]
MDATEAARFVFGSPNRLAVLRALRETPGRPGDVAERVDVSRATAQRCLRDCAERGWVERADGDYRPTATGARVVRVCDALLTDLDAIDAAAALLDDLPCFDSPLPLGPLADAELVVSTPEQPHRAARAFAERIDESDADHYDCLSPMMTRLHIDAFDARLDDGASVELVCPASVVDAEREVRPENVARSLALPSFDLYVHPERFEYALTVTDEEVFVATVGRSRAMRAVAWTADDDLREWARERYAAEKRAAERVEAE